jgi:CxxC motif-containing protein (DUF1111 family)
MPGRIGWFVAIGWAVAAVGSWAQAEDSKPAKSDSVALGYEIFNREWLPDDPRSHGGDGLGPVYNDTSCVACHNSGGSGGAGPASKNIDILSASRGLAELVVRQVRSELAREEKAKSPVPSDESRSASRETLADRHAGFRTGRTVVLHKFGTDPNYDSWRSRAFNSPKRSLSDGQILKELEVEVLRPMAPPPIQRSEVTARKVGRAVEDASSPRAEARIREILAEIMASNPGLRRSSVAVGGFVVARSQRNPTPLFGLGAIDAIPDAAIEAMERYQAMHTPETKGRTSRLKDGRIGRLGWKGQTANTEDFVLNACAVELGLEVPGHKQAVVPQAPKYRPPGLDLNADECDALVAYVRSLPKPVERRSSSPAESQLIASGKAAFATIGCANCHAAKLGDVDGIYSDLLLHDMGNALGDDGSYDPDDPSDPDDPPSPNPDDRAVATRQPTTTMGQALAAAQARRGAGKREWRTPPLWGFRDSGPYLHDGRAQTLEQAVAMHGGQGAASAQKFLELSPGERLQVEAFLKSLVAPPPVQLARSGE